VFLEDYDMQLARWMVTGVDVWLNNPITPLEASGTSGIKAAVNGRLNLSILDGWWAEAFDGDNGWGIPGADVNDDRRRDELDSAAVLDAIEEEVAPLYYDRNASGFSHGWVQRSRHAMSTVIPRFNMRRTVRDYLAGMYLPSARQGERLLADNAAGATALAAWKSRVRASWPSVRIVSVRDEPRGVEPGSPLRMTVSVDLGGLTAADLRVEFKARRLLPESKFDLAPLCSFGHEPPEGQWRAEFTPTGMATGDGTAVYSVSAVPPTTGQFQLEVRVYPWHELLSHPLEVGLMKTL